MSTQFNHFTTRPLNAEEVMLCHRNKLHNDYHNFKTRLNDILRNNMEPDEIYALARELNHTVLCCARNAHKLWLQRHKKKLLDDVVINAEVRKYKTGELIFPKSSSKAFQSAASR